MNNIKTAFLIIFILLVFSACKTTREMTFDRSNLIETDKMDAVISSYYDWNTFTAKGKITLKGTDKASSAMQIKMERNKFILISLRPMMGVEMWNLYITNDSIFIVDKMNKFNASESLENFSMGFPLDITAMQDLFLNRAFIIGQGTLSNKNKDLTNITDQKKGKWTVSPKDGIADFDYSFTFNKKNQLERLLADKGLKDEPYTVEYGDFMKSPWGYFARRFVINTKIDNYPFYLKLSYNSKVIWDGKLKAKFKKNKRYKNVSLKEYLNLF